MPTYEIFLLWVLIGAATGSVTALIKTSPTLIAIPCLYFFFPVFDLSFEGLMLPIVATCIIAFIPANLYAWLSSMRSGAVDHQTLMKYAPGIAMGGVIGAQLLSLIDITTFKFLFSCMAVIAILSSVFFIKYENESEDKNITTESRMTNLPLGLAIGGMSLITGSNGEVFSRILCQFKKIALSRQQGTVEGLVLFSSIAALVGFVYPAQSFDHYNLSDFVGALHIPSVTILAISHLFFFLALP